MDLRRRRRLMDMFNIKSINFLPLRYIWEIHGNSCPICLEPMNILKSGRKFKGCNTCTFWAHKPCVVGCSTCPQCRCPWNNF